LIRNKYPFIISLIGIGAMNAIYLYYAYKGYSEGKNPINQQR